MASIRMAQSNDLYKLRMLAILVYSKTFEKDNNPTDFKIYIEEAFSKEKLKSEFQEERSQYFVALENETIIGYARVRENTEVDDLIGKNNIELQRLYVDLDWQGKGIANQLMKVCEEFAADKNKEWIWLGVWEHNPKAQHYYSKNGYEKFSEHRFMMGNDPQTDWLMKKRIINK